MNLEKTGEGRVYERLVMMRGRKHFSSWIDWVNRNTAKLRSIPPSRIVRDNAN